MWPAGGGAKNIQISMGAINSADNGHFGIRNRPGCCLASPRNDTERPPPGPRPNTTVDPDHEGADYPLLRRCRPEPPADIIPVHGCVVGKRDLERSVETDVFARPRHRGLTKSIEVQVLATDH